MNRSAGAVKFVQTLVVAFGLVALVGAGSPASANQSGPGVNEATQFQVALCEAGGGTATIDLERTVNAGLAWTLVRCKGGLLDGTECYNGQYSGSHQCTFASRTQDARAGSRDVQSISDVEIQSNDPTVEDVATSGEPPIQSVDPVVTEEPVVEDAPMVEDEPVDPLPPVVDESPLDETIPDVEVVEADPVVSDEPVVEDIPQIEVVDGDVIPLQEIQEDLPEFEPAQ